jgi:hypothetical protein
LAKKSVVCVNVVVVVFVEVWKRRTIIWCDNVFIFACHYMFSAFYQEAEKEKWEGKKTKNNFLGLLEKIT